MITPHPQSFWFGRSGWGPRMCISSIFLSDTDAAGPGTTLHADRLSGVSQGGPRKSAQEQKVRMREAGTASSAS